MTTIGASDDEINAVARAAAGIVQPATTRVAIRRILDSDDPDVHHALIAALVRHGALAWDEQSCATPDGFHIRKRLATPWRAEGDK